MQLPLLPFQILRERTDRPTGHKNCPSSSLPFPISTPEWEGFRKLFLFLLAPPFISHIFLFFLFLLCVFAAPFCASDRGRQRRSVQRSNVCLAGFFLKKNYTAASPFPFYFSSKVLCIVLGNRRACPTFYFDALRGPVLFLFFSFGRSHCLISVLRA